MLKMNFWGKKKYVNRFLVEGGWNFLYYIIIINFMLIGFVNWSFYYYMRFVDFWVEGLVLVYGF